MKRTVLALASVCSLTVAAAAQWSTPTPVANLNTTTFDYGPCLSFDGLTMYFTSLLQGGGDIYRATRTSPYGAFGTPVQVTELASPNEDWSPWVRFDDREIFFSSQRPGGVGGGVYDLWRADRPSNAVPFNAPVPVAELNTASWEYSPSLTLDGLRIYFTTDRPGGTGKTDIWTATRPSWSSPFGTATPVMELNTTDQDRDPRVSPDNLVMFFISDRPGGVGSADLWMATRLDTSAPFGNIVNVAALNSSGMENSPAFAMFSDEIVFASSRTGGLGGLDLYSARFTGLVGFGFATQSSSQDLRFSAPSSPGNLYIAASSLGTSPGIPIDTRLLPLNADTLLQLSIGGLPPILTGYVGALDQAGIGAGRINFASFPGFRGLHFFTAFVVADVSAPSGIKTISNSYETLVQ